YEIRTSKDRYKTKFIVSADGVTSPSLKHLGWPRITKNNLILTITQEMKSTSQNIARSLGENAVHLFFGIRNFIPVGYAWLFPKEKTITAGWGNQLDLVTNGKAEYERFMSLPFVKSVLNKALVMRFKAHLIPVGLRPVLYNQGVFAVGDAGGLVDPISGKGIPYAMLSGKFAAQAIIQGISNSDITQIGEKYLMKLKKSFLTILQAKRVARDTIFHNDEILKQFLALWERYRSSEIILKKMLPEIPLNE
ncbi:MAG: NAD(P)/FAD-dependent oxidoreductase, partial [Candidatus Hodarchaeales archaeon]